jgi:polar amino acid transport system substrate-binding protein
MTVPIRRRFACLAVPSTLLAAALPRSAKAGGLFDDIKGRGTVSVATEAAYAPFEFIQDGKIAGYDEDLLHAIVQAWGVKLQQIDVPFAGILVGLDQRKYDFVCTAMIYNHERVTKYAFTRPIAVAPVALLKRKGDDKVKTVADLTGVTIGEGVPPGGPTAIFDAHNTTLKTQDKAAAKVMLFQSGPDCLLALANHQVDAIVDTTLIFDKVMKEHPDKFEIVGTIGTPFYYGWATRSGDLDLRKAINDELDTMLKNGEIAKLQQKWFGYVMEMPEKDYMPPGAI